MHCSHQQCAEANCFKHHGSVGGINTILQMLVLVATLLFGFSVGMFDWGDANTFAAANLQAQQFPPWMLAKYDMTRSTNDIVSYNFARDATAATGFSFAALAIVLIMSFSLSTAGIEEDDKASMQVWLKWMMPVIPTVIIILIYAANKMFSASNWFSVALFPNYNNLTVVTDGSDWEAFLSRATYYNQTRVLWFGIVPIAVMIVWTLVNHRNYRRWVVQKHEAGQPLVALVASNEDQILSKLAKLVADELQRRGDTA